jgi:hypothetical protein
MKVYRGLEVVMSEEFIESLSSSLVSFSVGSRVAGYRLEERIGAGGMGVVFRAVDEQLGRQAALKLLSPALAADEEFRKRFIRESRAAAAVDDPHIIPIYGAGEGRGVLFIAMRYVPGGDLRTLLHRMGPLPPTRVAAIISQVASALDSAHGAGLVHRDVKPANILLDARPSRPDHVYLSDFGLSKRALSVAGLTQSGVFLGTPDYSAPEQIEGKAVDGRADQYSLACSAFELLSGAPPFARDPATAVIWAHMSEPPPTLSSRLPGLPVAADQVFLRALAKAPADRYPSCIEFSDVLRQALGVLPYQSAAGAVQSAGYPVHDYPDATHSATEIARPEVAAAGISSGPAAVRQSVPPHPGYASAVARIRIARLRDEALQAARSIKDERSRTKALISVAGALAAIDPDRAARLLGRAKPRMNKTSGIYDDWEMQLHLVEALIDVAGALADTDPDRAALLLVDAEDLAQQTSWTQGTLAIIAVAKAVAATDPDRAARLLADAERLAQSIPDDLGKPLAVGSVALALMVTDPDRAARLLTDAEGTARSIEDAFRRAHALEGIATMLALTDPDEAERVAQSIREDWQKDEALYGVAVAIADADPDRAQRLAESIKMLEGLKLEALTYVAAALAATDADRAERLAESIRGERWKAEALSYVVEALAATNPERALRLARSITAQDFRAEGLRSVAAALAATDPDRAARLHADAARVAPSIVDRSASALLNLAEALESG